MNAQTFGVIIGLAVGTLLLSWLGYRLGRRRRYKHPNPKKWQYLGRLSEIHIYPVKSAASVEVDQAVCGNFGLEINGWRDRCLVAIDEHGKFAYAGTYPCMLSIKPSVEGTDLLHVTAPNMDRLTINLMQVLNKGETQEVQREGFLVPLVECNKEHHKWFSKAILGRESGMKVHIALDPIVDKNWFRMIEPEHFAVMVLHRKSIQDLNKRLDNSAQVDPKQFRGNLIIDSDERIPPYDEDKWMWLRIGTDAEQQVILRYNSDCLRCILINVNTDTCQRNANFEPLKTLKKYRLTTHPKDPAMGVYFDVYKNGLLKTDDPVYVQYK